MLFRGIPLRRNLLQSIHCVQRCGCLSISVRVARAVRGDIDERHLVRHGCAWRLKMPQQRPRPRCQTDTIEIDTGHTFLGVSNKNILAIRAEANWAITRLQEGDGFRISAVNRTEFERTFPGLHQHIPAVESHQEARGSWFSQGDVISVQVEQMCPTVISDERGCTMVPFLRPKRKFRMNAIRSDSGSG